MKYGHGWQPAAVDWSSTRGRILLEASLLFAQRGYFGTSTRDIAEAVKIRQPSLFHHFQAKHEIFRTLIELDLGPSIDRIRRRSGEPSAPELGLFRLRVGHVSLAWPGASAVSATATRSNG